MTKLAWLTDIHLNFLSQEKRMDFYQEIIDAAIDVVLISGDIAEAPTVADMLQEMSETIKKPIYFVLGNHDFYGGKIKDAHQKIWDTSNDKTIIYLPTYAGRQINTETAIVGVDSWADGRYGDYENSRVRLNDHVHIEDFKGLEFTRAQILDKMQELADNDAVWLYIKIRDVVIDCRPKKIIILVHVPPFKEASTYNGKMSTDDYLPFFASKVTGDVLLKAAQEHPEIEFLVLCGHTHGKAEYKPLDNLTVKAGAAEYGKPTIQEIIEI